MVRYCPHCGRNIPDEARLCPYCEKTLAMHEGIRQPSYPVEQKKDNTALIIAIVLIIVIIIPIAIAATVYVYVSGMIGSHSQIYETPDINMQASLYESSDKNATIIIDAISGETAYWYSFYFTVYDVTDGETLFQSIDYTISKSNFGVISQGDKIEITGEGNELEAGHEYRLSIIYMLNYEEIETVPWTQ